jgi:hypothetical protein
VPSSPQKDVADDEPACEPVAESPTAVWISPGVIVKAELGMPAREPHHGACRCDACRAAIRDPDIRFV